MADELAQQGELPGAAEANEPARALAPLVALLSLLCVAPLLAWVFGLGRFAVWFGVLSAPSLLALVGVAVFLARRFPDSRLVTGMVLGAAGGFLGTILYDLARVPFVAVGMRLFAPIDSYGVLLTDASASSGLTDFAGWTYHFANGICFGVAYGALMLGRAKWWAVLWAMILESAAVLTPFAVVYGLRANPTAIVIAYGAHVPYGLAVGYFVREGRPMVAKLREITARPVTATIVGLVAVLAVWLRPVPPFPDAAVTDVRNGRFVPAFLRVAPGGCAVLTNRDDRAYTIGAAVGAPVLAAGASVSACFAGPGVHRVKTAEEPYSGGFVIVDEALG